MTPTPRVPFAMDMSAMDGWVVDGRVLGGGGRGSSPPLPPPPPQSGAEVLEAPKKIFGLK